MILGIDPGLHGALVIYDPATRRITDAWNVPTFELTRNRKLKRAVDIHALVASVRQRKTWITHAWQELVGPIHKQGVSSVWSFARGDAALETTIVAHDIPFSRVPPQVWKKAVGAPADKDGARLRASQLMPEDAWRWTPKRLVINQQDAEGIAEAALIAYYGAHQKISLDASVGAHV